MSFFLPNLFRNLVTVSVLIGFFLAPVFFVHAIEDSVAPTISNVRVENIYGYGAEVRWDTNESSSSYVLYGTSPDSFPYNISGDCSGNINVTSHCIYFTNLSYSTPYYYKVRSKDSSNNEALSAQYSFTSGSSSGNYYNTTSASTYYSTTTSSGAYSTIPTAPYNLTAIPNSENTKIILNWVDSSSNEENFSIYRRLSGGAWALIASVFANTTTYTNENISQGTYEYHVNACTATLCSSDSNIASASISGIIIQQSSTGDATPSVSGWGFGVNSQAGSSTIGIAFNVEMDTTTFTDSNIYVYKALDPSDPTYRIPVVYQRYEYSVNLVPNAPLVAGIEYISVVKASVKSKKEKTLAADYVCRFTALVSGYYTSCPSAQSFVVSPPPTISTTTSQISTSSPPVSLLYGMASVFVVDSSNNPVAGVGVHIFTEDFNLSFGGQTDIHGRASVQVSPGTYTIEIFAPENRNDFIKPAVSSFSIRGGETKTLTLTFGASTKFITGTVRFSNGTPITDAEVGAYSEASGQWTSIFTNASGAFTLRVGSGTWKMGIRPVDPLKAVWRWSGPFQEIQFGAEAISETKTASFVVPVSDAIVTVYVVGENNVPIRDASIILDTISGSEEKTETLRVPPEYRQSDETGVAVFKTGAGIYYVRTFLPHTFGYIHPDEQRITVSAGQSIEIKLVFKKQAREEVATVRGIAKLEDGRPIDAFIWAWSEKSGSVQTRADSNGNFSFTAIQGERWHIGAGKELDQTPYKSSEIVLDIESQTVPIEIILVRFSKETLPPPVTITKTAAEQIVVQAEDGAKTVIPAGATAVGSGSVSVEIKSTVEAPSQIAAKVVSGVYDITVKDQNGKLVTELQKDIEIILPYDEKELENQGVTEGNLIPSYFDESAGTWIKIDNYTIDKEKNIVIARVNHLTRFALISAADVIPPSSPSNVTASLVSGAVLLQWKNPTADFSHARIYRSTKAGTLGAVAFAEVKETSQKDLAVSNGTKYYYTIRAIDPAGNESANVNQTSIVVSGVLSVAASDSGVLTRNLKLGMRGDDVRLLQSVLLKDGVYPEGLLTGYFGVLTFKAAVRFQEKYASEVLTPIGLQTGTGFVGKLTRLKLSTISKK